MNIISHKSIIIKYMNHSFVQNSIKNDIPFNFIYKIHFNHNNNNNFRFRRPGSPQKLLLMSGWFVWKTDFKYSKTRNRIFNTIRSKDKHFRVDSNRCQLSHDLTYPGLNWFWTSLRSPLPSAKDISGAELLPNIKDLRTIWS